MTEQEAALRAVRPIRFCLLSGRNRHGDLPVIECWLPPAAEPPEPSADGEWTQRFDALISSLTGKSWACRRIEASPRQSCAFRIAAAVTTLQQSAGFRVAHCGALGPVPAAPIRFFAEFDDEEAGEQAVQLALALLETALASRNDESPPPASLLERYAALCKLGRERATPADTRALIDAARRRGVPWQRMDRDPFDPVVGDFRIRPHGLLRLGQGRRRLTVDGTFCIERSADVHRFIRDRAALARRLSGMGLALPSADGADHATATSPIRAARIARRIGFPVAVASARAGRGRQRLRAHDEESVRRAAAQLLATDSAVVVQRDARAACVELLFIGPDLVAASVADAAGGASRVSLDRVQDMIAPDAFAAVVRCVAGLDVLSTSLAVALERPGRRASATVLDFDLAPSLNSWFIDDPAGLQRAAERMLEWLFPDRSNGRIPIAAITGTNGKTTTSLMLERAIREAGHVVGLACSTGSFVAGRAVSQLEDGYLPGHLTVLDHSDVEWAVLETTRGAALTTGIGFDRCDVAACLNVSDDHLEPDAGIATVGDMARVKRWIVERGGRVVLNADDEHCLAMAFALAERDPMLVSASSDSEALRARIGRPVATCVLDVVEGCERIVVHDGRQRMEIVDTHDLPTTFGGRARHNVVNAMHAAATAYVLGVAKDAIAAGLRALAPDADSAPGRLNLYRAGGTDFLVDYAHNPAGLAQLVAFCNQMDVSGRRIIAMSLPADRGDRFVIDGVAEIAGHFDLYVCKNYRIRYGREPHEVPRLLQVGLERAGVAAARIVRIEDEDEAIAHALEISRPGDLIVLVVGKGFRDLGRQVQRFARERAGDRTRPA